MKAETKREATLKQNAPSRQVGETVDRFTADAGMSERQRSLTGARRNLDALAVLGDKPAMDDIPTDPWTMVKLLLFFAAMFGLGAGYFWFRFATVQAERESKGGPITIRWLREAGTATALTMFCASAAFFVALSLS